MSLLDDFKRWLADLGAAAVYKTWAKQNPGELSRWIGYRDALLAGESPPAPTMVTPFAKSLVDVGLLYDHARAPAPSLGRPFSLASAFNKPIPVSPPVHPDSAQMLSQATTWLFPGSYQEWLGPRDRVFWMRAPLASLPTQQISVNYDDAVGEECGLHHVRAPMPSGWETLVGPSADSFDRITWLTDPSTGDVWEGYRVTPPGTPSMDVSCDSSAWNAIRMDLFLGEEKTGLGYGHGFAASGSGILCGAGLLIPDDFADLDVASIPHALRINWNCGAAEKDAHPQFVPPASAGDGKMPGGVPMGSRVQLDPGIDVGSWPSVAAKSEPWRSALRLILRTLQKYGAVPVDSSGCAGCGGLEAADHRSVAPYTFPWQGLGDYQRGVPYDLLSHFRVIDWRQWTGA